VRRELAGRAVSVGQGAKVLFGAWIWPEARDVEEGLRPDWGKGAILGVPMGGCFSQEEHRLQSRPAEAAGPDGLKKSKSDSKAIASVLAPPKDVVDLQVEGYGNVNIFTYNELRAATKNFRPDQILGEGGFGVVYKGVIDENVRAGFPSRQVAVKELNPEGFQGDKEWLAEVNYLGQLSHPNLVELIGYCCEGSHRLLVYEYMACGSLEKHLFRRVCLNMPWSTRMKIALGAARGLEYLHGAERSIIYRDFKTSNILLDADYNAKLSDFGLARTGPSGDQTHVSTRVMGTYGYAAPEYVMTGKDGIPYIIRKQVYVIKRKMNMFSRMNRHFILLVQIC